jgi:hypothetical protein
MHGWMTSRHEGCVSTMLTDKRLEYCTVGAPLQGSGATKWMMQADKHGISGAFRLDDAPRAEAFRDKLPSQLGIKLSGQTLCRTKFAFPDRYNSPTELFKLATHVSVAYHVRCKLVLPEVHSGLWRIGKSAALMPVPETTMHEYHRSVTRQY